VSFAGCRKERTRATSKLGSPRKVRVYCENWALGAMALELLHRIYARLKK